MNGFLPQSIETAMEVQYIADLSLNIITPRTSMPIIAQKQDQLLGAYNMTANKYKYDWRTLMNLLSSTEGALDYKIEKNKQYHGRDMFSYILPKNVNISFKQDGNRPEIRIKNGIITDGQLANDSLGEGKDEGIVQIIWDQYGPVKTKTFIDNSTKLINNFNLFHGMSVGIGDLIIDNENYNKLQLIFDQKKLEVEYEITKTENNPDLSQDTLLEEILKSKLEVLRDTSSKLLRSVLDKDNNFFKMFDSGSKGKDIQLAQMAGCVGQQDYHGGRIPKSYNGRTLPYFFQNDDRATARGFIQNSFLSGLELEEFIFNHMTAREGLIDQAVRTADSGYVQRKLIKSTEDYMVGYDGTVRNAVGRICQYIYGDSGADSTKQFKHIFHIMDKGDKDVEIEFKMTKDEINNVKNFTDKDNNDYYKLMLHVRDHLRITQMKASMDRFALNKRYMLPVNLKRIIISKSNEPSTGKVMNEPKYILDRIEELLLNKNTTLMCLTKEDQENPNAIKNKDDKLAKTAFKFALYDILAPKKCIFRYKFTKEQLDEIFEEIKTNFNKNIVQAGEMVGIIAAQSLGEPITQLMLNAIHSAGVKGKGGMNIGVDRFKEIFSLSRNIKVPYMVLYFEEEYTKKKDFVYKIASHIKLTRMSDVRSSIEIYYDPDPLKEDGFTKKDNITNIFGKKSNKLSNEYDLTWLLRIKFDKEKMLNREITLIDIKSQLLNTWTRFLKDKKNIEKDKKVILDKISQMAILSNTDNDDTPVIHIRFDMQNITSVRLIEFMDNFIDNFKLKGMKGIVDIGQRKPVEERVIKFDKDNALIHENEYVIYTNGINIDEILDVVGVDINKIYCNDIITVFENYGIDAARNVIIREITSVLKGNGSSTNYQHIEIFADMMTNMGTLTSIDRHGLSKLDTDPLSRASFEKTVEQLIQAAVFNEVDNMKSVSSRIMAGLCIKGGTGVFDIAIDTELLLNSEYTVDVAQLYKKTFDNIIEDKPQEIHDDVYIPDGDI